MRSLKRDDLSAADKRPSFTPDQLQAFFNGDYYRGCALGPGAAYRHADKAWRFWLPLICLLMGLRPKEVCQLHTADVAVTANGTHFLDVVASTDDDEANAKPKKTTKTKSSRRRVPIHPELIAIGFLEFVREQREASDDPRLFRDLKINKYGDPASYALKRFRETYLPREIELRPRQSFYSFRHTFRDALRRIEAPPDALQALGGWSQNKLVSDNYGDKNNPDYNMKYVACIAYVDLDLSSLHIVA